MSMVYDRLNVYICYDVKQKDGSLKTVATVEGSCNDPDVCKCSHDFRKDIVIDKAILDTVKAIATGEIQTAAEAVIVGVKK
jgi:hypothetical protein